ncbi:unnamed protein product [Adineta ricciae]|uniref:LITAF domain-containing protein n=1 Tax=Adineta ricciae TaxID=249248 RepID=A0A814GCH4_ADIRI|nr:unnamed protein product [Adineta ricciae]CAF1243868.1 unnamed protein product [Adineta ricciae]
MTDTKEAEANASLTLLEIKENTAAQQPPTYGTVTSQASSSSAPKSPSDSIVISVPEVFDHDPTSCLCWNCHQRIVTRTEKKIGYLPWIICMAIGCLCCWLGCCLIPFCIRDLKDTEHYCPNCGTFLAQKRRV